MLAKKIVEKLWAANPDDWGPIVAAELEPVREALADADNVLSTIETDCDYGPDPAVVAEVKAALLLIDGEGQ